MTRDEALDKIKKLLRMQRGGTQAEVETALRLAQEIAAKHGIDLQGVNPEEERGTQIGHEDTLTGARIQWECKYAGLITEHFFNVRIIVRQFAWRKYGISFIGTEWDRQVALYVYSFLVGHFRREWRHRRGRCRNRQAFMYGMYHGICAKLAEQQPAAPEASSALVLHNQTLAAYVGRTFGQLREESSVPDGDAMAAKWRGYCAGRETEIRKGVQGAVPQERLLA